MSKEAMKLALEALGAYMSATDSEEDAKAHSLMAEAFFKIKEALAQPEQEPTGCACRWDSEGDRVVTCARHEGWLEVIAEWADRAREAEKKLKALAQPEQERSDTRPCRSCDGTGERFTGIDEAPTSICKPCKGTGQIALAEQPAQQEQGDSICQEDDGCPTELAVLQRFWRGQSIPYEHYPTWCKPAPVPEPCKHEPVDSEEKAGAYMEARLWEFIDMAAAWPKASPDPRTWDHVMVYAPKPAQQEPVAWVCYGSNNKHDIDFFEDEIADLAVGTKLYTQAQRTWVGLTEKERKLVRNNVNYNRFVTAGEYAEHVQKATEFKLLEKNT